MSKRCSFHFVRLVCTVITSRGGGEFEGGPHLVGRTERLHREMALGWNLTVQGESQRGVGKEGIFRLENYSKAEVVFRFSKKLECRATVFVF